MSEPNEAIAQMVWMWWQEGAPPEVLISYLASRENELVERILVLAATHHLPAATIRQQLYLMGMGSPPSQGQVELTAGLAEIERNQR